MDPLYILLPPYYTPSFIEAAFSLPPVLSRVHISQLAEGMDYRPIKVACFINPGGGIRLFGRGIIRLPKSLPLYTPAPLSQAFLMRWKKIFCMTLGIGSFLPRTTLQKQLAKARSLPPPRISFPFLS